jgi:hypothetical protein
VVLVARLLQAQVVRAVLAETAREVAVALPVILVTAV